MKLFMIENDKALKHKLKIINFIKYNKKYKYIKKNIFSIFQVSAVVKNKLFGVDKIFLI